MPVIKEMFAFIIANTNKEDEGIPAVGTSLGIMPLVGADMARIDSLRAAAKDTADRAGKPVILAKFSVREDVEVIHPATTKLENASCPKCGSVNDAATPADGNKNIGPKPGDLSVCFTCASYLTYDDKLGIRLMTEEELKELPPETSMELYKIKRAIENLRGKLS